jgi:hypothetical protein
MLRLLSWLILVLRLVKLINVKFTQNMLYCTILCTCAHHIYVYIYIYVFFKDGNMIPYDAFKTGFLSGLPMNHGGHSLVARGLYALQLKPWLEAFPGKIKICFIGSMKGDKCKVNICY